MKPRVGASKELIAFEKSQNLDKFLDLRYWVEYVHNDGLLDT